MKLPDALQGIRLIALDSAPLIYLIEKHPEYLARMLFIMRYIDSGSIAGMSAAIALTEVLVHPLRIGNHDLARDYEGILLNSQGFRLVPIDAAAARRAADLRARYSLRMPDALHLATAIEAGAGVFLTNDRDLRRVNEMRVLALDDLELDEQMAEA